MSLSSKQWGFVVVVMLEIASDVSVKFQDNQLYILSDRLTKIYNVRVN